MCDTTVVLSHVETNTVVMSLLGTIGLQLLVLSDGFSRPVGRCLKNIRMSMYTYSEVVLFHLSD